MNRQEPPPFSPRSLAIWLALGLLGIGLAVAIALVAHNLADQPLGLAAEPVSAGRALDPPGSPVSGDSPGRANAGQGSEGRNKERTYAPGESPGGGSTVAPAPVAPAPAAPAPVAPASGSSPSTGGSDDSHHSDHAGHENHHDGHDSDD